MENNTPIKYYPDLLMCSPKYFAVREPHHEHGYFNSFEEEGYKQFFLNPTSFCQEATQQWFNLKKIFTNYANIIEIEPSQNLLDQVFTADSSFSLETNGDITIVLSKFKHGEREGEVSHHKNFFLSMGRKLTTSPYALEGTGDNIYDPFRDIIWAGHAANDTLHAKDGRSDKRAHSHLGKETGVAVVSLQMCEPFYHIDTIMAPLTRGHVLVYEAGMFKKTFQKFKSHAFERFNLDPEEYMIRVSEEDAMRFAINLRCFGDDIVMPECSDDLKQTLLDLNYRPKTLNVSHFIAAGGAVHCMSNIINEQRIIGGYIKAQESNLHNHHELKGRAGIFVPAFLQMN